MRDRFDGSSLAEGRLDIVPLVASDALALPLVLQQGLERHNILACGGALKLAGVQDLLHDDRHVVELADFVANCALENAAINVCLVVSLGELNVAGPARALEAVGALDDLCSDHHAQRALDVGRELVEFLSLVEVFHGERTDRSGVSKSHYLL